MNVQSKDSRGDTLLHLAIQSGNEHMVQVLLDSDADIKIRNNLRQEPLHEAAMFGNEIIAEIEARDTYNGS